MNEILKKRIEEASYEDADGLYPRYFAHHAVRMGGFFAGAEYALSHQWISVEEALPDENEEVLCMMKSNHAIVSGYIYKENGIATVATSPDFEFEDYGDYEAVAWMPRPELKSNDNG